VSRAPSVRLGPSAGSSRVAPSLPNRDAASNAPPPKLAPRSIVRIDAHGSLDRVKDASPRRRLRSLVPARVAYALLVRMRTTFPSSAPKGHPLSSARRRKWRNHFRKADRTEASVPTTPREGRRLPGDQDAFHRHDTRRTALVSNAEGLLLPAFTPALPLTPPTLFPCDGECVS